VTILNILIGCTCKVVFDCQPTTIKLILKSSLKEPKHVILFIYNIDIKKIKLTMYL